MTSKFMVAPIGQGLRKDIKPFATPEDSFTTLTNAIQFRGRIIRRQGYRALGKLANGTPVMGLRTQEGFNVNIQNLIAFDLTTSYLFNGTAFVTLPSVMPVTWSGTDYQFFYSTNYADAFWATNSKAGLHGRVVSNAVGAAGVTTITTSLAHGFTTGQSVSLINLGGMDDLNGNTYVITVTGANTFTIPFESTGTYTTGGMALNNSVSITGQDGIRYYGVLSNGTGWANYNPPINPNNALAGALLIFPYRGYLVFLNTTEGNEDGLINYGNRARWTQIGTPFYSAPQPVFPGPQGIDQNAARDDLFGVGGANDAPTNEVIVGAEFIRDILVVYFQRSSWRLRFVNNSQNPFVWERVNKDLGCDCTFSTVAFDKGLMGISNRGIVICDANDTERFDEKIPEEIFQIRQANFGFNRVHGIRTFRTKLTYWTYPSSTNPEGTYPDKLLVFNYDTKNWSFYDDCFTCFGYYYPSGTPLTWGDLPDSWSSYTDITWDSGISQVGYENIIAGNQQGYVFILEQGMQNSPSLSISNITDSTMTLANAVVTSANNNLENETWIKLTGITGVTDEFGCSLNDRNYKIAMDTYPSDTFILQQFKPIDGGTASGSTYSYDIEYSDLFPGSIQINVGSTDIFTDPDVNGVLVSSIGSGTIDYDSGEINLVFDPPIAPSQVIIRIVSLDPLQGLSPVNTNGTYTGGGEITKISGIDIQTKIFNFMDIDQRARLSKIDFYVNSTDNGEFICNVFADSGNDAVNAPLIDNLESNVVLTTTNPYQVGEGEQTIYRLYCDAVAQTIQLQFTFSDQQMATDCINQSNVEILAMIFTLRKGGRLI